MDQAIEVQNYTAVHSARGSSRYVPCSSNAKSALLRTLLATAVPWKIHPVKFYLRREVDPTRGKLRHFDMELEQLQLDKVVVEQVLVDYSHAGLIVT